MNKFLKNVLEIYEHHGVNFNELFHWHLHFGMVFSDTNSFSLFFFSKSETPDQACEMHDSDTLFVTIHSGEMQNTLRKFRNDFKYIAFQREFKNSPKVRVYDMQQFYSKLK